MGLVHMVFVKNIKFLHPFFLAKIGRENVCVDVLHVCQKTMNEEYFLTKILLWVNPLWKIEFRGLIKLVIFRLEWLVFSMWKITKPSLSLKISKFFERMYKLNNIAC